MILLTLYTHELSFPCIQEPHNLLNRPTHPFKMKTTYKNENDLKNIDDLKIEDDFKNEDDLKNEDEYCHTPIY